MRPLWINSTDNSCTSRRDDDVTTARTLVHEDHLKSMHFDADRMLLIQNLPVSSVLWPSHFRRDAVGVPTRREQQIDQQQLQVVAAQAAVATDQAALIFSRQQSSRYAGLAHIGAATVQDSQQWQADISEKEAALARDGAQVGVARKQIDLFGAALDQAKAVLAQQQAAADQAELNLGYTTITAPVNGTVGRRSLRVGQYVQAGTELMEIVPLSAVYVTANYKETQLPDVRPGQPVTIAVDMFPGVPVHGVVNSVAPASGEEFSLLPPDNATGNYTKIVQRIPVKITIEPHDRLLGQLRPGMSAEPTVDTKSKG
jgi:membrane fusion protein, multidrug efflux system